MILVTGATGLVGGNLLWHLLQENDRVIAIRRSTSNLESLRTIFSFYTSTPDVYLDKIEWRTGDVLDSASLMEAMQEVTIVYHCAAIVSLGNNADNLTDTNVQGTKNVVDAALKTGIKKLCFVSSIAACERTASDKYIDEKMIWTENTNRSHYAQSKYYSEQEVWTGIKQGLNAVIVNPGVILGVSGSESGSSQLFTQVRKGLQYYTNGGTGYVDVQDVVKVMIQLTKSEISGERYVLVGENCSHRDILCWIADGFKMYRPFIPVGERTLLLVGTVSEIVGKLFHFRPLIDRRTARAATHREFYSSRKIETAINFQFTSIEKCIKDVCSFQLKNEN